jgi:hypothetical protein
VGCIWEGRMRQPCPRLQWFSRRQARNVLEQTKNNLIRINTLGFRLEGGHNSVSQNGECQRFNVLHAHV